MKALTDNLPRLAPPLWLTLVLATVVAATLLVVFVDTLHKNARHGEEFRQSQRSGAVRHPLGATANVAPLSLTPQLGASISSKFQR